MHFDLAGLLLVIVAITKLWLAERRIRGTVEAAHRDAIAKLEQVHTLVNHELEELKKLIYADGMRAGREALLEEQKEIYGSE